MIEVLHWSSSKINYVCPVVCLNNMKNCSHLNFFHNEIQNFSQFVSFMFHVSTFEVRNLKVICL
jgi:hypothetical protein